MALPTFSATTPDGASAALALGQLPQLIQQAQMQQLLLQQQKMATGTQMEDLIRQQVQTNPALLNDPKTAQSLDRVTKASGLPSATLPATQGTLYNPASQGIPIQGTKNVTPVQAPSAPAIPGQAAHGETINPSFMTSPMTGPQQTAQEDRVMALFSKTAAPALKSGKYEQVKAIVKSTTAQLMRGHENDSNYAAYVQNLMSPYLDQAIGELSPNEAMKLKADIDKEESMADRNEALAGGQASKDALEDAQRKQILDMLGPKIDNIRSEIHEREVKNAETVERTRDMKFLLGPKMAKIRSDIKKNDEQITRWSSENALSAAEASHYREMVMQAKASGNVPPAVRSAAINAASNMVRSDGAGIVQLQGRLQAFEASINADPTSRTSAQPMIDSIRKQIDDLTTERSGYQQQLQELQLSVYGGMTPYGYGLPPAYPTDPSSGLPGGPQPQPQQSAAPAAPGTPSPNPSATPGTGKVVSAADLATIAKQHYGGDIAKARKDAIARGYTVGN